jgi:hypothetical protein
MKLAGAYTLHEEGEERFFVVLECGCHIGVVIHDVFESDLPCPLHEPQRYLGPDSR